MKLLVKTFPNTETIHRRDVKRQRLEDLDTE